MKIIDSIWFTSLNKPGCVGIVIGEDAEGRRKAYVGIGNGWDQMADEIGIASNGAPFESILAERLLGLLSKESPA